MLLLALFGFVAPLHAANQTKIENGPWVGDPAYGGGGRNKMKLASPEVRKRIEEFSHQALHAYLIGFIHPKTGEMMRFEAPLTSNINRLIKELEKV